MSKVYIFCAGATGHLNPMLALAKALKAAGEDITFFSTSNSLPLVQKAGIDKIKSIEIPGDALSDVDPKIAKNGSYVWELIINIVYGSMELYYEEIKTDPPDYFIRDIMSLDARFMAKNFRIPLVCNVPVFGFPSKFFGATPYGFEYEILFNMFFQIPNIYRYFKIASKLKKKYRLSTYDVTTLHNSYDDLNIITTSRFFQFYSDRFSKDNFCFCGPLIDKDRELPVIHEKKPENGIIYISLGTVYGKNPGFYRMCIEAFGNTGRLVYITTGGQYDPKVLDVDIPENVIIEQYLPQLQLLERAGVFITHGGMNSINESFLYGVPVIVVPQALDQFLTGARTKELGAGIYMKNPSAKKLKKAAEKIFKDTSYKNNAEKIGKTLKEAGGTGRAVERIMEFKKQRNVM